MNRLTTPQRYKIAQLFYRKNNSERTVYRLLRNNYDQFNHPTKGTIRNTVQKNGSNEDMVSRVHHHGSIR